MMNYFDLLAAKTLSGGGGSGGSDYTLLYSGEVECSTTAQAEQTIASINVPGAWDADKILYIRIRDKAGARGGHFYMSNCFAFNTEAANGSAGALSLEMFKTYANYSAALGYSCKNSNYGIYPKRISSKGTLGIVSRYDGSNAIDGTFSIDVYLLDFPGGASPF